MTDKQIDNPPAFPQGQTPQGPSGGMSLRDWFAGQALAGLLSGAHARRLNTDMAKVMGQTTPNFVAGLSYEYADAMIAARKGADQ